MAQCINPLPGRHEDQSLNPQNPHPAHTGTEEHICSSSTSMEASPVYATANHRLCLKQGGRYEPTLEVVL